MEVVIEKTDVSLFKQQVVSSAEDQGEIIVGFKYSVKRVTGDP